MFIELHILQNFAPSNLNRDDTGAPKDCEFGGYRRARVSSQCLKRAIRTAFRERGLLPDENLAARTKRLLEELVTRLVEKGKPGTEAPQVAEAALRGIGLGIEDDGKTEYLLFLGEAEIAALADLCQRHWDSLAAIASPSGAAAPSAGPPGRASARAAKRAGREVIPAEVRRALETVFNGGKAADLALFGRMLADRPEKNVDAACQVAHAISTNRVSVEFDFYTAVDDLKPEETAGADMMGTVEFNSACFYRYANVDLEQLRANLGSDEQLARRTLEAFVRASVAAVPTGKQNSMAAQNPPSFVLAVARRTGLWSLANAFVRPVQPDQRGDLVQNSVAALDSYWGQLTGMYGDETVVGKWYATLDGGALKCLGDKPARVANFEALVQDVAGAVTFGGGDGRA